MDYANTIFSPWLSWIINAVALLLFLAVLRHCEWRRMLARPTFGNWTLTMGFIFTIWMLRAEVPGGLTLHLSLAPLFALLAGWRAAMVGLGVVCIAAVIAGRVLPLNLGLQYLLHAALPVSLAFGLFLASEAYLKRNFFVYIFLPGFFGAWLCNAALAHAHGLVLTLSGTQDWSGLYTLFIPYHLILGFSEAFLTGAVLTLFAVYYPHLVYTFRDERYIIGK